MPIMVSNFIKGEKLLKGKEEVAQWLRPLVALAEDLSIVPSIQDHFQIKKKKKQIQVVTSRYGFYICDLVNCWTSILRKIIVNGRKKGDVKG